MLFLFGWAFAIQFCANSAHAKQILVSTQQEYQSIRDTLKPGDNVVLANGVWRDFEILFHGKGTANQPITLSAQRKGQVIISGESNLSLHGEYLVVEGLVFKNGYTPTSSVISFRSSRQDFANNSRVTEVVIDDFSNPERFDSDHWVTLYGKNNRFDHNHLSAKRNKGVTLAVRLDSPESRENNHRIDHNYFGPRQILGSNGGETLRVGTSHHSLTNSRTVVENNYFDRCDGELEIISNKSGNNSFIGNVFFESRGTLTMRHGNDTLVEGNVFFGNGVDHTGGIRLINKRQTIRNNYMEGLAGYRFGGALVVMNGVPNSPINRYHQVTDSLITNNSLINSSHIQLAAGSDLERSAVPVSTVFKNNLIFNQDSRDIFTVYDDVSGMSFRNNLINAVEKPTLEKGFVSKAFSVKRASNGLVYPSEIDAKDIGLPRDIQPIEKSATGVSWYPKPQKTKIIGVGKTIQVLPGQGTLNVAVKMATAGDILSLMPGQYIEPKLIVVDKPLQIRSSEYGLGKSTKNGSVNILFEKSSLFEIQNGGSLSLQGLSISGALAPDSAGNSVIRTLRRSMLNNYQLAIESVKVSALNINHSFNFLSVSKGSFADRIDITDSSFVDVTGAILALDKESDDYGIYNAEYVRISNSTFENIEGDLVDFYRGGTDESTFGPHFELSNSKLVKIGHGKRNKSKSSILLHGVQVTNIEGNEIVDSKALTVRHTVGEPVTGITDNKFINTPEISVIELNSDKENTASLIRNTFSSTTN